MPRPAIVIGLGGTGSWVLSWLKKDLVETHGSLDKVPVRLLLIDTADIITDVGQPGVDGVQVQGKDSDVLRGSYSRFIILDRDEEFLRIPTAHDVSSVLNIRSAVLRRDPNVEHFTHWFRPEVFPQQSLVSLPDGAGQFRQLGRLALLLGIHIHGPDDQVYSNLRNLIERTAQAVDPGGQRELDIHIVGSFAGGTGSGIFLDVAWLVRKVTPLDVKLFITGFFALPNVWTQNLSMEMRAKTFAAWRELNRMLTIREKHNEFMVRWGIGPQKIYEVQEPAYDQVYLVDPGGRQLQNREPEKSIFPIMAEAISFFLDKYSGTTYIQHITSNINKRRTSPEYFNRPTYSTLYVKAFKVPLYHFVNMTRHDTATAFMNRLLRIEEAPGFDATGNPRTVYRLASDPLGANRAAEIFNGDLVGVGNTRFIALQAQIRQIEAVDWRAQVQHYARHADTLLQNYAEMPHDPRGKEIWDEVQEVLTHSVPRFQSTSNPLQIQANLDTARITLYGRNNAGGEYVRIYGDFAGERYKGELYDKLEYVQQFHLEILRQRIRAWMERELNTRGGQFSGLSTVLAALKQLVQDLEKSIAFFTEIAKEITPIQVAERHARTAYNRAHNMAQRTGIIPTVANVLGLGARRAFNDWYQAERKHLSVRRSHRAVERAIGTLEAMRDYVDKVALASVREMERQLVSYDDPLYRGVYRSLQESREDEKRRHSYDQSLGDVIEVLGEEADIPPVDQQKVTALLDGTTWTVDEDLNVRLHIRLPNRQEPIVLDTRPGDKLQSFDLVRDLLESVADPLVRTSGVHTALEFKGVESLVDSLVSCQDTLYTPDPIYAVQDPYRTFYVRTVYDPAQEESFQQLLNRKGILAAQAPDRGGVALVRSENPHKIVIFSANELLLPEHFAEWRQCQNDYRTLVVGDRSRGITSHYETIRSDHLFAAEQNALEMEYKYHRQNYGNFPTLGHRLVHLLEHRDRLVRFFQLWAIDCVRLTEGRGGAVIWTVVNPRRPNNVFALCPRTNHSMLDVLERYVLYGRPMDNDARYIDYDFLHQDLEETLSNTWYEDSAQREALLMRYTYESSAAAAVGKVLPAVIERPIVDIREVLDQSFEAERQKPDYRLTLAEELAYDLTRMRERGAELIPSGERRVHLDAVQILTRLLFEDLANGVRQMIDDRSRL